MFVVDPVLRSWLEGCAASHRRLETLAEAVTDDVARRPCLLPGWTVGHLLTHIARNADSQRRMLRGAQRGDIVDQYEGGADGRATDIEMGQARSAAVLAADVLATNAELERAYGETTDEVWRTGLGRMVSGSKEAVAELVFRRWREAEVHTVDLGLTDLGGPGWDALAPSYLDIEWERVLEGLGRRVDHEHTLILVPGDRPSRAFGGGEHHVVVRATPGTILGWLIGRGGEPDWPELGPWG